MFEIVTPRGILHSESDFLQRDTSVIVRSQNVDAGFLQRAEKASLAGRFVIVALTVVLAIPHQLVLEYAGIPSPET